MKNIIIAILAIALIISGYFIYRLNQEDSKTFKISKGKDAVKINFYGIKRANYNLAISEGKPIPAPEQAGSMVMPTLDNSCNGAYSQCCGCLYTVKDPPQPDPPIQDSLKRWSEEFVNLHVYSIEPRR